ncbi:MAG: transposase [Pseudomonadota bacterium]
MTRPRKELVSVESTPYYHIVSCCVRRTFLCGYDATTNTCYEHRRQWIEERIRLLSSLFAVDICAYAVLSNHYHLVVKIDPSKAELWSETDVVQRWQCLYKGPLLIQHFTAGHSLSQAERNTLSDILQEYKRRLCDLSWFMKCLNEPIARQANREDGCTGHFWEARYKSQALLTKAALVSAMAYVDLNPIRAGIASTPETSDYTSIKERIQPRFELNKAIHNAINQGNLNGFTVPLKPLLTFNEIVVDDYQNGISFNFADYLALINWSGRAIRDDKRGSISNQLPPILDRLAIEPEIWLENSTQFEARYRQRFQQRYIKLISDTG